MSDAPIPDGFELVDTQPVPEGFEAVDAPIPDGFEAVDDPGMSWPVEAPVSESSWFEPFAPKETVDPEAEALRAAFKVALISPADAKALNVARALNVPVGNVTGRLDGVGNLEALEMAAKAAEFDPVRFKKENPLLTRVLLDNPHLGKAVTTSKPLSLATKALNAASDFVFDATASIRDAVPQEAKDAVKSAADVLNPTGSSVLGPLNVPGNAAQTVSDLLSMKGLTPEQRAKRDQPKTATEYEDEQSQAYRNSFFSGLKIPVARGIEQFKQMEVARLKTRRMKLELAGEDTAAIDAEIHDATLAASPRAYGEKGLTYNLGVGMGGAASTAAILPDALEKGGIGAAAGALAGGLIGLRGGPAAMARGMAVGAEKGAEIGAMLGVWTGSFDLETGSEYEALRAMKTEDGNRLSVEQAAGAAALGAAFSATVETLTIKQTLGGLGPLKNLFSVSIRDRVAERMAASIGMRSALARVGTKLAKSSGTEAGEEVVQTGGKDVVNWASASLLDGRQQSHAIFQADYPEAFTSGFLGGLLLGLPDASLTIGAKAIEVRRATIGARQAPAILDLAQDEMAQAGAKDFAKAIQEQTAAQGEEVTALFVDPYAITQYFQGTKTSPDEAAAQLKEILGDDATQKLEEAQATGQKLEIPLETVLRTFGASELGKALRDDTTTRRDAPTPRQLADGEMEKMLAEAEQIVAEASDKLETGAEVSGLVEDIKKQMRAAGRTRREADVAAVLFKAFYQTRASEKGVSVQEMFNQYRVAIGLAQTEDTAQFLTDRLLGNLPGQSGPLDLSTMARERFVDPVTNLRNRRGWDFSARKPGTRVIAVSTGDTKAINDAEKGGHDTSNEMFALMGRAIGSIDNEAMRDGTKFYLHGNEADLSTVLAAVRAVLPAGINVDAAIGDTAEQAGTLVGDLIDAKQLDGTYKPRGVSDFKVETLNAETFKQPTATPAFEPNLSDAMLEQVSNLSPAQQFDDVYLDPLIPGLLSKVGFDAAPARNWVASIDLKGLAKVNTRLSKAMGNQLMAAFGKAATMVGGSAVDLAHLSGDEFAAKHDSREELEAFLQDLEAELSRVVVEVYAGDVLAGSLTPLFRSGIGERTYGNADRVLNAAKRKETQAPDGGGVRDIAGFRDSRQTADVRSEISRSGDRQLGGRESLRRRVAAPSFRGQQEVDTSFDFGQDAVPQAIEPFTADQLAQAEAYVGRLLSKKRKKYGRELIDFLKGEGPKPSSDGFEEMAIRIAGFGLIHPDLMVNAKDNRLEFAQVKTKSLKQQMKKGTRSTGEGRLAMSRLRASGTTQNPTRYEQGPTNESRSAEDVARELGVKLDVLKSNGVWNLSRIVVPEGDRGRGLGSEVMDALVRDADAERATITLTPSTDFGGSSKARLTEFYKRWGFVENRGKNKDFAFRETMYRLRRGALSPTRYDQDPVRQLPKKLMAAFNLGKRALSELGPDASRSAVDQWLYGLPIDDLPEGTEEVSAFNEGLKGGEPPGYVRGWRYGPVPDSGFSRNFRDDVRERGVSLMQIEGGGIDAGTFKMFNSDRPKYLVDGFLLSVSGSDGEPLIIGAQNIRKIDGRLSERNVFYQDPKDAEARGFSNIPGLEEQERAYSIFLNPTADQSTIVHEAAHVFLDVLAHAAVQLDASPRTKEIFDGFLKWVGAESREAITREQHEKFARGFEAFLFEGKAPSRELETVFGRFRRWLVNIYRSIMGLNVELNDDVRKLYSRLLATEEEINQHLGKSGALEEGPLTEQEQDEVNFATRKAALASAKAYLKETEGFWKEELSKQKALANTAYELLPARVTERALSKMDLDRAAVERLVGKAAAKKFRTIAEEGVLPDEAAVLNGYATGEEMLKAVLSLPEKKQWVADKAEAETKALHSDVAKEKAELTKLVQDGLHQYTETKLLREWPALSRELPAMKRAAQMMAERRSIKSLRANDALIQERKAAREKAIAGVKGETAKALAAARRQMLNAQLYRELLNAEDEKERFLDLADELASKASRQRFGKSAPEFRDASDHILGSLGLANLEAPDYAKVVSAIAVMEADAVSVGEWRDSLADLLQKGSWEALTVSEMRVVNDALLNIRAASRNRASLMLGKRSIDKAEVVDRLLSSISPRLEMKKGRASRSAMSLTEKMVDRAQEIDAFLLNPVDLVRDLSGDDLNSPWHEYLIAPMREAKQKESDLLKKTIEPVTKAMEAMPSSVRSTLSASIDGEKLFPGHIRDLVPRKRYELLMMALNAGNAGNLQRLLDGRNITPEQLKAALDLLTAEEIQWVQAVFDAAESLKAEAFAVEERDSGLRPKAVEATPQILKNGILRGGYFPAVYDKSASQIGERQAAQSLSQLMDPSYTRGSTPHSHTKSRSEAVLGAAISLEPSVIYRHLAQVAHDIAFRETVKSVGSVILDSRIDTALKNYLGVKKAEQFLSWVKDVGSMRLAENDVGQLISWARSHLSVSALGWSLPTAIGDLANVPAAVFSTQLKSGSVLNGLLAFLDPSKDIYGKSLELSGEMRFMRDTTRKNFDKHLKAFTEGQSYLLAPLRWVKEHAFDFMEIINKATATPIWWGAYEQAKNEFDGDKTTPEAEAYAVKFADDVLTRVFPSHSAVDQAAILRDRGFWGMTTMFYGYMSTMYRAQHNIINRPDGFWKKFGNLAGFYIAAGLFGELLMGRGPEGDDEKESQWKWAMRKLIAAPLSTVPLPFAAGVEAALLNKKPNAKTSPVMALVDTAARYGPQLFTDPDLSKKADAAWRLAGPAFGIPQRPMQSAKFVVDWASGETVPRGPLDVGSGLIYGERNNQAQNLLTGMSDAVNGPKN